MKYFLTFIGVVCFFSNSIGKNKDVKPTLIYFHTSWCSYCKIQQKLIVKDTSLYYLLNENFNFIDFNGESSDDFNFQNKIYKANKKGNHEFVNALFYPKKQIAYPAWIILNKNNEIVFSHEGLLKNKALKNLIEKFLENKNGE